jgi:hypothetical protein
MQIAPLLVLCLCVIVHVHAQGGCVVGKTTCTSTSGALMQTLLIETDTTGTTQIQVNVSNYCSGGYGAIYVEFLMTDINGVTLTPSIRPANGSYFQGHYTWTTANNVVDTNFATGGTIPRSPYFRFSAKSYGSSSGTPTNNYFTPDNGNGYYNWEIFKFYVTGYTPQFQWYWIAHFGSSFSVNGPLGTF